MNPTIESMLNWEETNNFGLHIVTSQDTEELWTEIRDKIQQILNIAHEKRPDLHKKENVTMEKIDKYRKFASEEVIAELEKTVRKKHVYYISDVHWNIEKWDLSLNDKLIHDIFALDSIKEHWARTTNLIQACMPYARQDKLTKSKREPFSFKLISKWISDITWENWYIWALDLHNQASESLFWNTNFVNLNIWWFIQRCIENMWVDNPILCPTDQWWANKVEWIAKEYKLGNITVIKSRDYSKPNTVNETKIYWDVEWKDILIYDDMLDTWGTLCSLIREILLKKPRSLNVAITHWMFNWQAFEKLKSVFEESNWIIKKIYTTNSIKRTNLPDFIEQIDISNIIANMIVSIYKWESIDKNGDKNHVN